MISHELLTFVTAWCDPVSTREVREHFADPEPDNQIAKALGRARGRGYLRQVRKEGRAIYYELTTQGAKQLAWWNNNGCKAKGCSCHRRQKG